jgi:hypothetical protein
MAKRVGKYKITKRESALNLTDGGTIDGNLTATGTVTLSSLGTTDPGVSGRLFTTGSVTGTTLAAVTGSARFVLASQG